MRVLLLPLLLSMIMMVSAIDRHHLHHLQQQVLDVQQEQQANHVEQEQEQQQHSFVLRDLYNQFVSSNMDVDKFYASKVEKSTDPKIKEMFGKLAKATTSEDATKASTDILKGIKSDPKEDEFYINLLNNFKQATKNNIKASHAAAEARLSPRLIVLLNSGYSMIESLERIDDIKKLIKPNIMLSVGIKWVDGTKLPDLTVENLDTKLMWWVRSSHQPLLDAWKTHLTNKQKGTQMAKFGMDAVLERIEGKISEPHFRDLPGPPGSGMIIGNKMTTVGICLQNAAGRRDKVIGNFHWAYNMNKWVWVHVGDENAWHGRWSIPIGSITAGEHVLYDADLISLWSNGQCTCGGDVANVFNSPGAVGAAMYLETVALAADAPEPSLKAVGVVTGNYRPVIMNPFYARAYLEDGPMWMFHTSRGSVKGDSGGPLVYRGQVIGVLYGLYVSLYNLWSPVWNMRGGPRDAQDGNGLGNYPNIWPPGYNIC